MTSSHFGFFLLAAVLAVASSAEHQIVASNVEQEFVVTPEQLGAVGDGKANDWAPIQLAVTSCSTQALPCRVLFDGNYLSGPIVLSSSSITLDIRGSLSMLPKHKYGDITSAFISNSNGTGACKIVGPGYRVCLSDIRITGGGSISSTSPWWWWVCKYTGCFRPHLIVLHQVHRLRIDNIFLRDAPNHHIEVDECVNVRVENIEAVSPHLSPNTDGINFYGGFDQMLRDSTISNGDDCVSVVPIGLGKPSCVHSPEALECRGGNVIVQNVSCFGGHGISIGGVRHGSVTNVTFQNMTATGGPTQDKYATGGVRVKSYPNSTGLVSNIVYRDIVFDNVYLPLQLLGHYCPWPCNTPDGTTAVQFSDITFQNIRGSGKQRHVVGDFSCSPLAPCKNIKVIDVNLVAYSWPFGRSAPRIECNSAPSVLFERSSPGACSSASTLYV